MLSSGVGRGLVCEASRVLSWLSLRAPGPQAVLCSSHMQMWLAGLSVDGTQARRAPACPVLHPPVPKTVQPLGRVGVDVGMKKDAGAVRSGGGAGWTTLTVGSQMAWIGGCRRLKVELSPAEAREDSM